MQHKMNTLHENEYLLASYGLILGILEENSERFENISIAVHGNLISFNEAMDNVVCSIPKLLT